MFLQALANPMELFALAMFALNDKKIAVDQNKSPGHLLCYELLNKTSRSFARVIQALDEELKHPIAIFYLVLRALDTIEDDMTLPLGRKIELLKSFHEFTQQKGWNFQDSGPDEKDSILLKEYHVVIEELWLLKPVYQNHIISITKRMGVGMAEFVQGKEVITMKDYNLYTHYVAGLVGLGLTGLFVSSGMETEKLQDESKLSNEMGLFLQKVNILKDFTADSEEGRLYWPKDIWSLYVSPGGGNYYSDKTLLN
jgi:farnesyl-diphosphate farnesyltransferase